MACSQTFKSGIYVKGYYKFEVRIYGDSSQDLLTIVYCKRTVRPLMHCSEEWFVHRHSLSIYSALFPFHHQHCSVGGTRKMWKRERFPKNNYVKIRCWILSFFCNGCNCMIKNYLTCYLIYKHFFFRMIQNLPVSMLHAAHSPSSVLSYRYQEIKIWNGLFWCIHAS